MNKTDKVINVTKTYLPPMEEYGKYLQQVWDRSVVTNNGPLVRELEEKLRSYFGVKHLFFASNGTVVLQMAIKALNLKGKVITTPFSYVATTSALMWEGCSPVFVDIEPQTCSIDASKIEAAITPDTVAIMATHVYGLPCDVERIDAIARKHGLKVIYDAAHAYGTVYKGKQLMSYGDISTISFHATKLFHTIEGGAIVTNDDEVAQRIRLFRSFGHIMDEYFVPGINGKNSEFHAAMGLCLFDRVPAFIERRVALKNMYDGLLAGAAVQYPEIPADTVYNCAYYPILVKDEATLLKVKSALEAENIFPRRYFFPSLNTLPYVDKFPCPVSEDIAPRIMCLPFYVEIEDADVKRIAEIVKRNV